MKKLHRKHRPDRPARPATKPPPRHEQDKPIASVPLARLSASDAPELAWRLAKRVHREESAGHRTGYHRLLHDLLAARRVVFSRGFALLVEDSRTEDMGVTITSVSAARVPPGLSWWEWDARIAGRLPPRPGEMHCDRTGVLIRSDSTGQRGTLHMVSGGRFPGDTEALVEISPLACHFDWREDWEPPASIVSAASIEDVRAARERVADPTLAELESSPVAVAAISRRFGVAESPYVTADYTLLLGDGGRPWHEQEPELLRVALQDAMQEVSFMLSAAILLNTASIAITQVPRGARLPAAASWGQRAPFNYNVIDYAAADPARLSVAGGT